MNNYHLTQEEADIIEDINMDLMDVLDDTPTRESLISISIVTADIICSSAPSIKEALSAVKEMADYLEEAIRSCDSEGMCRWNKKKATQ